MPTTQSVSRDPTLEAHLFWYNYRREILMGLIIVVAAVIAYGGYWMYNERREGAAAALLSSSHDAAGYQQVISQYETTPAGTTAYLMLADAQRKDGKYADANATLQKFLDKNAKHELAPTARMAMAANLQSMGKMDEALASYQRVAADFPKSYDAPLALISQVTIFKDKGQPDAARRVCETILTQYRDSIWANEAMGQLRELKPPPSAASGPGLPGGPSLGQQGPGVPPMLARPPSAPAPAPSAGAPAASAGAPAAPPPPKKP